MPTSDSYYDDLILRLKDPNYAALYIETHMELEENEELDPQLLQMALSYVAQALGTKNNMTEEQIKQHQQQLDSILSKPGYEGIYTLGNWLNMLGLKLTVVTSNNSNLHKIDNSVNSQVTV